MQLQHRLHNVMQVIHVAPHFVDYNWYWAGLGFYWHFQLAFVMCSSTIPARYVAVVLQSLRGFALSKVLCITNWLFAIQWSILSLSFFLFYIFLAQQILFLWMLGNNNLMFSPVFCWHHKWLWCDQNLSYCNLLLQNVVEKVPHHIYTPFYPTTLLSLCLTK